MDIINLSWKEYQIAIEDLARQIKNYKIEGNDIPIDKIITIPRGGLPIACSLSHQLEDIPIGIFHLGIKYSDNKIYLIVDDIADSGGTLMQMINHIGIKNTFCAVLHYKEGVSRIRPDFFVFKPSREEWIIYPWETIKSTKGDGGGE